MGNLEEGLRWLDQARADLKTSKDCLEDGNYYASAFFAQQSAEKALKGFLYSKGFRALVTHSMLELLEESAALRDLSKHSWTMARSSTDTTLALDAPIFIHLVLLTNITQRRSGRDA